MDKLDHLGWVVSASFAIGDARFAVRSTSETFGAWVKETLGAYEVEDVEDFLYSVVVPEQPVEGRTRSKDYAILYKGATALLRSLDPATVARSLLAELEALRFEQRDDAVYVSASAMALHGKPALIPSGYAPMLSKVGRRLAKHRVALPGSMNVAIDLGSGEVVPVTSSLEVAEGALDRLAELLPARGADGLFFVDEPARFDAFLVPARELETPLQPTPRGYALANLANRVLNFERVGGRGLQALGRFVEQTPCYEMAWGDTADAIKQLADVVGEGAGT